MRETLIAKMSEDVAKTIEIADVRLSIKRGPLEIRAISPLIGEWVKKMEVKEEKNSGYEANLVPRLPAKNKVFADSKIKGSGITLRKLPDHFYVGNQGAYNLLPKDSSFISPNGVVNLCWLLAEGLEEGIVFQKSGLFTEQMREEIVDAFRVGILTFYKDHLRPWEAEMKLYSEVRQPRDQGAAS